MTSSLDFRQASFPDMCPVTAAVDELASVGGDQERGVVYTRPEIVDFILDLSGYTAARPLHEWSLLEPSFGDGDFLLPAVGRLLQAWTRSATPVAQLRNAVRAVELHRPTFDRTHARIVRLLEQAGIAPRDALSLANTWLVQGDFLLQDLRLTFDVVVGNPPYVRQELIPDVLLNEYRARYRTLHDRADLYVPFIEQSLSLLKDGGVFGCICADRWTKNKYGGPLRALVSRNFHLRTYVDMTGVQAFQADVTAYPAITVIARESAHATRVARAQAVDAKALAALTAALTARPMPACTLGVHELSDVTCGESPWLLGSAPQIQLLRRLEKDFLPLEDAQCKVGIGVATGADRAFIGPFDALDVEPDRKQPLAMTQDIQTGRVIWRGLGVVNPFKDGPGSGLVDLDRYPRLKRYLQARREEISGRHVARRSPANWYRTIDRITESLTARPKLLIPDIKGRPQIVYEDGKLYPHHNLYYVTSQAWDLQALQAVLLSDVARFFVASYSTKMRGGFLRFQAQYLRRIHIPPWAKVPAALRRELRAAAADLDLDACNRAAARLYGLTTQDLELIRGEGQRHGS